jgi:molybdopterin-guanine dinucleotide biosynthesis protein A
MGTETHTGVAAAILAGGAARRMGGADKAALRVGGERIIDRQLALLRQVADPVFIVSAHHERFADLQVPIVADVVPGAGAIGGIHTAVVMSPRPRTLVVACDMPFLTPALLRELTRPSVADVVIPRSPAGYEPLCATWAASCADPLRRRIEGGQLKVALALDDLLVEEIGPEVLARCDPRGLLFVNVNTPHDYERARERGG